MKKAIVTFSLAGLAILGFTSMKQIAASTISGKITPADGADAVWAIKDADSVKSTISTEGTFQLEVKPGTWKVVVAAKAPYQNAEMGAVEVTDEKDTDVGEIKLSQ
ncbi:MAG: carboxypeptidase regulatory-like domain-containing protein [Ferruginibacter sp.]